MTPRFAPLAVLALVALLPAAQAAQDPVPSEALGSAAQDLYDRTAPAYRGANLNRSIGEGAFLTAIELAGEALGGQWEDEAWEAAQRRPDPNAAFMINASGNLYLLEAPLAAAAADLRSETQRRDAADLGDLLIAARLLAQAEASYDAALRSMNVVQQSGAPASPLVRQGMTRSIYLGWSQMWAGQQILDAAGAQAATGGPHALDAMASRVTDAGGFKQPTLPNNGGPLLNLARHSRQWETSFVPPPNETLDDLRAVMAEAEAYRGGAVSRGLPVERLDAVLADARYWLARSETDYNQFLWNPLLSTLVGRVAGSMHELELMGGSTTGQAPLIPTWAWWGAAGAGVAALGAFTWRRRRGRPAPPVLALALLFLAAPGLAPPVDAVPLPADPDLAPVGFTQATGVAAIGNLALAGGLMHFVWSEDHDGDYVVRYRNHDPAGDSWSTPVTLVDAALNANSPRIVASGDALHVFWVEGYDPQDKASPVALRTCVLDGDRCGPSATLNAAGARTARMAVASGAGHVWVVYEQLAADGTARLWAREHAGSWRPAVDLGAGGLTQTEPAVAVDGTGKAHAAWRDVPDSKHPDIGEARYRTVAAGASSAGPFETISDRHTVRGSIAVHATPEGVQVIFDAATDGSSYPTRNNLYERHRGSTGGWSPSTNVSRGQGSGIWPTLRTDGPNVIAMWAESDTAQSFILKAAQFREGVWSRPVLVSVPGYPAFVPFFEVDGQGVMHLVWSGSSPGNQATQMQYLRVKPEFPSYPPTVKGITPGPGEWSGGDPVPLTVYYEADWPIGASSSVTVGGQAFPLQVQPDRLVASLPGLGEGAHAASLHIEDTHGGVVEQSWSFSIDRQAPRFDWSIVDAQGDPADGWGRDALFVKAASRPDGGAPAVAQGQFDGGSWANVAAAGMPVPEGRMYQVRVRAVDAAGNVELANPVEAGWDATPPAINFTAPAAWSSNGTVVLRFVPGGSASPEWVEASLLPAGAGETLLSVQGAAREGKIVLPAVPEGAYTLWASSGDAAGNLGPSHNWTVGVDRTRPTLDVEPLPNGTLRVLAQDATSGVASIQLQVDGAAVQEWPAGGNKSMDLFVPVREGWLFVARDVAGLAVDSDGNVPSDGEADGAPAGEDPLDLGQRGGGGIPAVPGAWLAVGLLGAAWFFSRRASL